ncbi:putative DNA binding domain-containing protein [Solirubrobacter ginsenosidimutans]|uniref:DNA binding domain-containing protein n=1 Tax=Solirubrobacter ginsenosidimutans TaxID=490573 RepID=A0A9X3MQ97_9ACTN|nr:RNA-binding domain-containing protein [Solirubrobacter ginsenosidimutans]MDA0159273.1 putative DNA binding domain-containing protein [Solirubrobacter ginsenosidimutans]
MDPTVLQSLEAVYAGDSADSHETERIDFKQENTRSRGDTEKLLVEATLCFANSSGGSIVVGVRNKPGGPDAFVGTTLDAVLLKQRIFEQTVPHLAVDVEAIDFHGTRLLVIRVPESPEIHADTQGRAPRRINTDCINMSPAEQLRHREDRRGIDWSAVASERPTPDVSRRALDVARELLSRHPSQERQALSRREDPELLTELGVLRQDGRLSRAGEILFCETADGSARLVYMYRETPGGEPTELRRFSEPLIVAYERVMELVEARRRLTPVTLPQGQQLPIEDFPNLAVREALTNAVVHRDYHTGAPVTISHSPQLFEISSPGPLVAGVTPANILTHDSKPRNALLTKAARVLGLAEEVGAGIDRMYREMIFAGNDLPGIDSDLERVLVTLTGGAANTRIPFYVSQLPSEERTDVDTLLVLYTLCHRQAISATDIAPLLQKRPESAQVTLKRLADDPVAMVEPSRGTARRRFPKYRLREHALQALGTAVRYNRRSIDQTDRRVIAHIDEYGKITNKTVRNYFDVDVGRARDILGDLVKRELLVKTSDATRGPSVTYGPGPKFPAKAGRGRQGSRSGSSPATDGIDDDDTLF